MLNHIALRKVFWRNNTVLIYQYKNEIQYWRNMLKRVFEVVKFASRDLPFHGSKEILRSPSNENSPMNGIIELIWIIMDLVKCLVQKVVKNFKLREFTINCNNARSAPLFNEKRLCCRESMYLCEYIYFHIFKLWYSFIDWSSIGLSIYIHFLCTIKILIIECWHLWVANFEQLRLIH